MKLLKLLIILILILFPFGELLRFEIGENIVVKPLDIVVGITSMVYFFQKTRKTQTTGKSESQKVRNSDSRLPIFRLSDLSGVLSILSFPIVLFAIIGFLSLLINTSWLQPSEFFVSLLYLLRWVSYIIIFFVILRFDKAFKQKLLWFLFFDGLIILFLGYLQYFFFSSLKGWYHLGWDEHMYRMFSVFLDPNFAGAFFVLYFLFVAGMFFVQKTQNTQKIGSSDFQKVGQSDISDMLSFPSVPKWFISLIFLFSLLAIFLTFSRASLFMLVVSSGIFLFMRQQKKLFLGLISIMLLFFILISPQFHIENMNIFRETSSKARLASYDFAIQVITDRPLLGVGFNSYRYAKSLYSGQPVWTQAPSHADAGVDNSFLFVLATTGVIGFITYLWLWIKILRVLFTKEKNNIFAIVLIASIIGLFIHALFINSLFFTSLMLWLWILLGITLN